MQARSEAKKPNVRGVRVYVGDIRGYWLLNATFKTTNTNTTLTLTTTHTSAHTNTYYQNILPLIIVLDYYTVIPL